MGRKTGKSDKNSIFSFAQNIEPILLKIGLLLIIVLFCIQTLHYYHIFQKKLNPIYSLEGNPIDGDNSISPYGIFCFTSNVKGNDAIVIKVNGIPIGKLEEKKSAFAYISSLDILEIDGTKSQGSYEVVISAEPTPFLPHGYSKTLRVKNKLYRLSSIY